MTADSAADPWLAAAGEEYYSQPHPPFGAQVAAYWRDGTMKMQELACGECVCGFDSMHAGVTRVAATMATGDAVRGRVPRETAVWLVQSGAPSAQTARSLALEVAKTLGWQLNPLFLEETTT